MKSAIVYFVITILAFASCNHAGQATKNFEQMNATVNDTVNFRNGLSEVNDIKMYYEIYGDGKPLVLIHGGGSTIQTSFGRVIPLLSKNRQLICVELQAHGRTGDRSTGTSFEQDADDVAAL